MGCWAALTWEALFGPESVTTATVPQGAYLAEVLRLARTAADKPVREDPRNSNRGPDVETYLRSVGLGPGYAWCAAFVYWCAQQAAKTLGCANPLVQTAGCLDHWKRAPGQGAKRIMAARAIAQPELVKPGMVLMIDHGRGLGQTGIVERRVGGLIYTIEGNTDASRGREGGGVYRLTRKVSEINAGFIDYRPCRVMEDSDA